MVISETLRLYPPVWTFNRRAFGGRGAAMHGDDLCHDGSADHPRHTSGSIPGPALELDRALAAGDRHAAARPPDPAADRTGVIGRRNPLDVSPVSTVTWLSDAPSWDAFS